MITFRDGPAAELSIDAPDAPLLTRVTRDEKGEFYLLDEPDDTVEEGETVFAYVRCGEPFAGFVDYSDGRGRKGEPFVLAEYRLLQHPPSDSILRAPGYWQAFVDGFTQDATEVTL